MSGETVIHFTKPGERESTKSKAQFNNIKAKYMSGETVIRFTKPGERESTTNKAQLNNMQQKICPERQ